MTYKHNKLANQPAGGRRFWVTAFAVFSAAACVVHAYTALAKDKPSEAEAPKRAAANRDPAKPLTQQAAEMRELIIASALRGRLEDLKDAIQWNELPPDFGADDAGQPIAALKALSADGSGYDVLVALLNVISMPHATVPLSKDVENPDLFVFPYLATRDLKTLSPRQTLDLYRLMPAKAASAMLESGRYSGWIATIAADGTWHSFRKGPALTAAPPVNSAK